jgi:aldehyde:ferredoxin oxidoreductase
MIEKITHREGVGDVLAEGILQAAEVFGRDTLGYANQSKGLPMVEIQNPEWTPYLKGGALAIAVGPRGDNMRSLPSEYALGHVEGVIEAASEVSGFEQKDPDTYEGKPELVASMEEIILLNDMLSTCKFIGGWALTVLTPKRLATFFSAGSGNETSVEDLFNYARKIRTMERAYEVGEGLTSGQETLPDRFFNNPIKKGPWKGAVLEPDKFEAMKVEYYLLRGWDPKTAAPTEETLVEMGLADVAADLKSKGMLPLPAR